MSQLNYDDFLNRINIQDVLKDAGYQLNRRDGIRYPSYVRIDSDGHRIKGDKFIVTANGKCCFQPPAQKNYNVIGFIREHPELFKEYQPGMSADRLVNLVCNRLLNNPIINRPSVNIASERSAKPFDIKDYTCLTFDRKDFSTQKPFYSYFKTRGISLDTQKAFAHNFFIAIKEASNNKTYTNLAFPLRKPNDLKTIVGLEERSRADINGKTAYKGMAAGSNATQGLWIASPMGKDLSQAKNVYWFESAFDAMAFYQIKKEQLDDTIGGYEYMQSEGTYNGSAEIKEFTRELFDLKKSVFVSTGGNPSIQQFKGMLAETSNANHHLCFDRDMAGRMFAMNFLIAKSGKNLKHFESIQKDFKDNRFSLNQLAEELHIDMTLRNDTLGEYMKTLKNDSIFSGNEDYLPKELLDLYGTYESNAIEYYAAKQGGLVCKEDLSDMEDELKKSNKAYSDALRNAVKEYRAQEDVKIYYEPCEESYKDWNDQLLDKKAYSQTDEIETALDADGNDVVIEKEEDYEKKESEENEEKQEEKKHSWFRR